MQFFCSFYYACPTTEWQTCFGVSKKHRNRLQCVLFSWSECTCTLYSVHLEVIGEKKSKFCRLRKKIICSFVCFCKTTNQYQKTFNQHRNLILVCVNSSKTRRQIYFYGWQSHYRWWPLWNLLLIVLNVNIYTNIYRQNVNSVSHSIGSFDIYFDSIRLLINARRMWLILLQNHFCSVFFFYFGFEDDSGDN